MQSTHLLWFYFPLPLFFFLFRLIIEFFAEEKIRMFSLLWHTLFVHIALFSIGAVSVRAAAWNSITLTATPDMIWGSKVFLEISTQDKPCMSCLSLWSNIQLMKIPSEMEVVLRYQLFVHCLHCQLFIPFKLFYTAETVACLPIYIVREVACCSCCMGWCAFE